MHTQGHVVTLKLYIIMVNGDAAGHYCNFSSKQKHLLKMSTYFLHGQESADIPQIENEFTSYPFVFMH